MSDTKLNIELFKKVRERIATIPQSYDQNAWFDPYADSPCGTAACLAGEAIICSAPSVKKGIAKLERANRAHRVPERAAKLLGLTGRFDGDDKDAEELVIFYTQAQGWPEPYNRQFQRARSNRARAKVAVAYLDHIIETGKVLK